MEVNNMMNNCKIFSLINYFDIWQDEEGMYIVNNQCVEKTGIFIADDTKDYEVIDYLKCIGFLNKDCKNSDINVNMDYDFIEVNTSAGYPLCAFVTEG